MSALDSWLQPKWNYRKAIFDAMDRYLTENPSVLDLAPSVQPMPASLEDVVHLTAETWRASF